VLPGETLSLEAYGSGVQENFAQAIEATEVCLFSITTLQQHWSHDHNFQRHCMKLLSDSLAKQARISALLNKTTAETRLAAFLLDIIDNYTQRQLRHDEIRLPMPRADIGNYLSLALETVSRTISRFEKRGLIRATGKHVRILDLAGLTALVPSAITQTESITF
jgi:CRP/FNR family transcriptional regulator